MPAQQTAARQRVISRILAQRERLPLDVMLDTMDYIFDAGRELIIKSKLSTDPNVAEGLEAQGLAKCVEACAIAKDAAGYLHAKLAAVQVSSDPNAPMVTQINIKGMPDDDLQKVKQLLLRNVNDDASA